MKLRSILAIKCAKWTSSIIKKLNRGSGATLPGYVALKIDPSILSVLADMVKEKIIVTMGTNGKTTTNAILYSALCAEGYQVIINRTGANMLNGIVSAFVLSTDKHCHLNADYACIEVDELASVQVLPRLKPDCALLTNISRDQLDRFGDIDLTFHKIKTAYQSVPNATLIINADDVISYSLAKESGNPMITYGIDEQIFDETSRSDIRESTFCHFCGEKLNYDFYHYGQLGSYHCPNCGLCRPDPDFTATNIEFDGNLYHFNFRDLNIHSTIQTSYNIYNTLSAYAGLHALGASMTHFKEMIESFDYGNNRENVFMIQNTKIQLHLAKNPVGFQQKVSMLLRDQKDKDIIVLINDAYQDGRDVSWLWDVDFHHLSQANASTITTAGTRKYDMALRLKYEDIPYHISDDLRATITDLISTGTGNLYLVVNYTGLLPCNQLLAKLENEFKGGEKA